MSGEATPLSLALEHAAKGRAIHPISPTNKRPLTPNGFRNATKDPAKIRFWWQQWPEAMIAMATGPESGLAVLDLDIETDPATGEVLKDGSAALHELMARNGWTLPDTVEARTPRGGRHLWFRHEPGFRCSTNSRLGIDARAEGGYAALPGSIRADGAQYVFTNPEGLFEVATAPDWLAHFFRTGEFPVSAMETPRQSTQEGAERGSPGNGSESGGAAEKALAGSAKALPEPFQHGSAPDTGSTDPEDVEAALAAFWDPDDYSDWQQAAMALHTLPGGLGIWLAWAKRSPKFDEAENRKKWQASEPTRGITARSILARAPREWLSDRARAGHQRRAGYELTTAGGSTSAGSSGAAARETQVSAGQPEGAAPSHLIEATPFGWPAPASIPPREWLYGRHLIRRFVAVTVAPGGVGKSSLAIADALAMASGRDLLGSAPSGALRVWVFNGEDPADEIDRRITAAAMHYGISEQDCADAGGAIFRNSGREQSLVVAREERDGVVIVRPLVDALIAEIRARNIDVLVIDPFVSCHEVSENNNGAIDRVAKLWGKIANETGCAIDLIHHARKTGGAEVTAEHARGAVALIAAARSVRVLNTMSEDEAAKAGIAESRRKYFSVEDGKANLAPPPDGKSWFKLESVELGNGESLTCGGKTIRAYGDQIGVVTRWEWPKPLDGISAGDILKAQRAVAESDAPCREAIQSPDWAGHVIGPAIGIDTGTKAGRAKVSAILKIWLETGMFKVVDGQDAKRMARKYVEVGVWANS